MPFYKPVLYSQQKNLCNILLMGKEAHLYNKNITKSQQTQEINMRHIFEGAYHGVGWGYFQSFIVVDGRVVTR